MRYEGKHSSIIKRKKYETGVRKINKCQKNELKRKRIEKIRMSAPENV